MIIALCSTAGRSLQNEYHPYPIKDLTYSNDAVVNTDHIYADIPVTSFKSVPSNRNSTVHVMENTLYEGTASAQSGGGVVIYEQVPAKPPLPGGGGTGKKASGDLESSNTPVKNPLYEAGASPTPPSLPTANEKQLTAHTHRTSDPGSWTLPLPSPSTPSQQALYECIEPKSKAPELPPRDAGPSELYAVPGPNSKATPQTSPNSTQPSLYDKLEPVAGAPKLASIPYARYE